MAEKKKRKSIYDKPLKDINKDGKVNFGDTWLGDALGFDGKMGIQKGRPGLRESLKGARRGKDEDKPKRSKSRPKSSSSSEKETKPLQRGPSTRARRTGPEAEDTLQRGPSTRRGPRRKEETTSTAQTSGNSRKSPKEYTYSEWSKMSRSERKAAGLPVSDIGGQLEFNRFMAGITGKNYTSQGNKTNTSGSSSRKNSRSGTSAGERGMARGGMTSKLARYQKNGSRDYKGSGMFYDSKSPRGYK